MNADEIKAILVKHKKWQDNEKDGERANPHGADLQGADLDMSCWPLLCCSLHVGKCDDRLVEQLLFHLDALPMSKKWRKIINKIPLKYRRAFAERRGDLREYRAKKPSEGGK